MQLFRRCHVRPKGSLDVTRRRADLLLVGLQLQLKTRWQLLSAAHHVDVVEAQLD